MKNKILISVLIVILIGTTSGFSQSLIMTKAPVKFQFFARDNMDSATINFSGMVTQLGYDSIILKTYRNNVIWKTIKTKLNYGMAGALFAINQKIHADTVEYSFRLHIKNNTVDSIKCSVDSIVCGDVFIINGQSNAVAHSSTVTYKNQFCRSFGMFTGVNSYNESDTIWGFANGMSSNFDNPYPFAVGAWGIRMMELLKEKLGVPICVINGAASGTSILLHQKDPGNSMNLNNLYGRLLYRLTKAQLVDQVKGLFWHQGEANIGMSSYNTEFDKLYNSWKSDYPNLKKIFVFQIHPGCGSSNVGASYLRDFQRQLPDIYSDIEVMSTLGLPGHDGCHYDDRGYTMMGEWIYGLVAQKLYGISFSQPVTAPNVKRAFYTSEKKDEIAILFRDKQDVVWQNDSTVNSNKFFLIHSLYLDNITGNINYGRANADSIILKLNSPSNARTIGYVPEMMYNGVYITYEGPWIWGKNGIGALSFYNVPLGCKNNNSPTLQDYSFEVSADSGAKTIVGTIKGIDPDKDILYYSITGGAPDSIFAIDSLSGKITLKDKLANSYTLTVQTRDTGSCHLSASATVNISLKYTSRNIEFTDKKNYAIYPNPAGDKLNISSTLPLPDNTIVKIFNITGIEKLCYNLKVISSKDYLIDISGLNAGYYLIEIETDEQRIIVPLIKK